VCPKRTDPYLRSRVLQMLTLLAIAGCSVLTAVLVTLVQKML